MKNESSNKEKVLSEIERVETLILWIKETPDKDRMPIELIRKFKKKISQAKEAIKDSELIQDDTYYELNESLKELMGLQISINLKEKPKPIMIIIDYDL